MDGDGFFTISSHDRNVQKIVDTRLKFSGSRIIFNPDNYTTFAGQKCDFETLPMSRQVKL
jgi:hypothetical protein